MTAGTNIRNFPGITKFPPLGLLSHRWREVERLQFNVLNVQLYKKTIQKVNEETREKGRNGVNE
jgi:hypothetical protein